MGEKLIAVAKNSERLYQAGHGRAWNEFWDILQRHGARQSYDNLFNNRYWTDQNFRPKYDIYASSLKTAFYGTEIVDLRGCMKQAGVSFNTGECTVFSQMFQSGNVKYVPEIDMSAALSTGYMFGTGCQIEEIDRLIVSAATVFSNVFNNSTQLREIRFTGVLGANNVSFQWCSKLSVESLLSILEVLEDKSGDTGGTLWKITLGPANVAKLTDEQLAIAERKGWTVV